MNGWSFRSYKKRSVLKSGSPAEVQSPTKIQFNLYWQTLGRLQLLFVIENTASVLRHEKNPKPSWKAETNSNKNVRPAYWTWLRRMKEAITFHERTIWTMASACFAKGRDDAQSTSLTLTIKGTAVLRYNEIVSYVITDGINYLISVWVSLQWGNISNNTYILYEFYYLSLTQTFKYIWKVKMPFLQHQQPLK